MDNEMSNAVRDHFKLNNDRRTELYDKHINVLVEKVGKDRIN